MTFHSSFICILLKDFYMQKLTFIFEKFHPLSCPNIFLIILLTLDRVRIFLHKNLFYKIKNPRFSLGYKSIIYYIYLQNSIQELTSSLTYLPSLGYALDRLVTVSSTCCHASTSALSTSSSSRGLTTLRWDISS